MPATAPTKSDAADRFGEKASELKDGLGEIVGLAGDVARDKIAKLKESGTKSATALKKGVEDYVNDNPLKALAISAGIGALAYYLVCRKA